MESPEWGMMHSLLQVPVKSAVFGRFCFARAYRDRSETYRQRNINRKHTVPIQNNGVSRHIYHRPEFVATIREGQILSPRPCPGVTRVKPSRPAGPLVPASMLVRLGGTKVLMWLHTPGSPAGDCLPSKQQPPPEPALKGKASLRPLPGWRLIINSDATNGIPVFCMWKTVLGILWR